MKNKLIAKIYSIRVTLVYYELQIFESPYVPEYWTYVVTPRTVLSGSVRREAYSSRLMSPAGRENMGVCGQTKWLAQLLQMNDWVLNSQDRLCSQGSSVVAESA